MDLLIFALMNCSIANRSSLPKLLLVLIGLLMSVGSVFASITAVGDPLYPANLPKALDQAYKSGTRDITINPGVYSLPRSGHQTFLCEQWKDATVHANGVTLIFQEVSECPVLLRHCSNVTWDGGKLLFVRPAYTQGRVIAVGSSEIEDYFDWQIDKGYPDYNSEKRSSFNVVDSATRLLKVGVSDCYALHFDRKELGLLRLYFALGTKQKISVNDRLLTRVEAGSNIFRLEDSSSCTVKNVTLENGGFGTFFETGGDGGNNYIDCKIRPGPRPKDATEDQLVACGADGFHSVGTKKGPNIEGCVFEGIFLDDCIAIHGRFERVLKADDNVMILSGTRTAATISEPLRIADTKGFFTQQTCSSILRQTDQNIRVMLEGNVLVPVDHSEDADVHKGTKISNPNYCGGHYKVVRCKLGNTRSRAILVKADHGTISGCIVEGCGMSAISIGPEFWWNEAGYCWDVTVSDNTFRDCNKTNGNQPTVWVHGDGAIGNRNIAIENNSFENSYGRYIIRIDATEGAKISGNKILLRDFANNQVMQDVIWLTQSRKIDLSNNVVKSQRAFKGHLIGFGAQMEVSEVRNANADGIRIVSPTTASAN